MADIDLEKMFPDMRPVGSMPSTANIYGCGFGFFGSRDHDEETGTLVKTHCLCLLFVPVFALRAFRIAPTTRGMYVLGVERLSGLAKLFNFGVIAAVLTAGSVYGWHTYTHRPNYIAKRNLAEADELASEGQFVEAAKKYHEVAIGDSDHVRTATQKLEEMVHDDLDRAELDAVAQVLEITVELNEREVLSSDMKKLVKRVDQLVRGHTDDNPRDAVKAIHVIVPPGTDLTSLGFDKAEDADFIAGFQQLREQTLRRIVADTPDDLEAVSQLAVLLESQGKFEECQTLLMPRAKQLGDSEGARVLGQILAREGKFEQAEELLLPYCEERLEKLHTAEQAMNQMVESKQQQLFDELREGEGPEEVQGRVDNAGSEAEAMAIVQEYLWEEVDKDFDIKRAQNKYVEATRVVPVALDLGIVLLRRGQNLEDPVARKASLEKAEKTFLSIKGAAGESDEYRLFLGQVYYWLGKQDQGRKQFDQLLADKGNDFQTLMILATTLREVGEVPQARERVEQAYYGTSDSQQKHKAAGMRAVMSIDLDDKIIWLRRADQSSKETEAHLNDALAEKAMRDGNKDKAINYLQKALSAYATQPKSPAILNNSALSYARLFHLTGDRTALTNAIERMDQAVAMSPSDSILLRNAASFVLSNAIRDLAGNLIDYDVLRTNGSMGHLSFLYDDEQSKMQLVKRLRSHKGIQRAVSYYERVVTLAPKSRTGYAELKSIYGFTDDLDELKRLRRRIDEGDPNFSDVNTQTLKYLSGEMDKEILALMDEDNNRLREALEQTNANDSPVTFAVASAELARGLASQSTIRSDLEPGDECVDLAEQAFTASPSAGTRQTLIVSLLSRADETLAFEHPGYKQLRDRYSRALSPPYLIPIAMNREGNLQDAVLANSDVNRAVKLIAEKLAMRPDSRSVWDWAMLRFTMPDLAGEVAGLIRSSEVERLQVSIDLRLNPTSGGYAYGMYWLKQIQQEEAAGVEVLRKCAESGVPLPWED